MAKLPERIFVGVCAALLFAGIATVNGQPAIVIVGWVAIGFPIDACIYVVIYFIGLRIKEI